jgi:hypothetical protein
MATENRIKRTIGLVLLTILVIGCVLVLRPFFAAVCVALILVVATWPTFRRLRRLLGGRRPAYVAIRYRDGLIIALLIACPMRLKNLTNLLIGQHLLFDGDACVVKSTGVAGNDFTVDVMRAGRSQGVERLSHLGGKSVPLIDARDECLIRRPRRTVPPDRDALGWCAPVGQSDTARGRPWHLGRAASALRLLMVIAGMAHSGDC